MNTRNILFFLSLILISVASQAGQKALVVIDIQRYFTIYYGTHWQYENPQKLEALRAEQIAMIHAAKAKGLPILVVEMASDNPAYKYGKTEDDIIHALGDYEKTKTIPKTTESLFNEKNSSLKQTLETLKEWNVSDLILIGANGSVCVRYTMQDALKRGFKVWAYTKGIIDQAYSYEFTYPFYFRTWFETKSDFKNLERQGLKERDSIEEIL